jgi:hypothetical protein
VSALPIVLSAGEVKEIEAARSGFHIDMHGNKIRLAPKHFARMVETFDTTRDHLLKIGHSPITTETPDYGRVVGLRHDENRDRLFAIARPTELLVEKNRKGGFKTVSAELAYFEKRDEFRFDHLAFLGAWRPAISGLTPVALAAFAGEQQLTDAELLDLVRRGDPVARFGEGRFAKTEMHDRIRSVLLARPELGYVETFKALGEPSLFKLAAENPGRAAELVSLAVRGDVAAAHPDYTWAESETHERVRELMLANVELRYTEALGLLGNAAGGVEP